MRKYFCNGCHKEKTPVGFTLEGSNVTLTCGNNLPNAGEEFHLCLTCATFAFTALKERRDTHAK
jgi:hypothetical protein